VLVAEVKVDIDQVEGGILASSSFKLNKISSCLNIISKSLVKK